LIKSASLHHCSKHHHASTTPSPDPTHATPPPSLSSLLPSPSLPSPPRHSHCPHPSTTNTKPLRLGHPHPPHTRDHGKQDREQRPPEKHRHQACSRTVCNPVPSRSAAQPRLLETKTEHNPFYAVRIIIPWKQCSNERVSWQEEHEQQTRVAPATGCLVEPRSQHEEDACERQGDYERKVDGDTVWRVVWQVHLSSIAIYYHPRRSWRCIRVHCFDPRSCPRVHAKAAGSRILRERKCKRQPGMVLTAFS